MSTYSDTIDVRDVLRTLSRGWREIVAFTALGTISALAVLLYAPRKFDGAASAVVQSAEPASALSRLGSGRNGVPSGLLAGITQPSLETELQILGSRAVAGVVVDSLLLQARVRSPADVPTLALVRALSLSGSFQRQRLRFERIGRGGEYQAIGDGIAGRATSGAPFAVAGGSLTLAQDLPPRFELELLDREDAITQMGKQLAIGRPGGDVVRVSYRANDSLTAARVPNLVLATYLARRKTADRGINQYRAEFLTAKIDSVARQLALAEERLRREREATGVLDPQLAGKIGLERASELRSQLTNVEVESGAINQLLSQVTGGGMSVRQLAAYPTFIKSSAVSDLVSQLSTLETERLKLLGTRTEQEPAVQAIAKSIASVEGQLKPLAQAYAATLDRQRTDLRRALDTVQAVLGGMPKVAIASGRLERDVLGLSTIYAALQTQLVEAKLAAISEGGDVRQLDVAQPPKLPAFPRPVSTMSVGIASGLVAGMVAALALALMGSWVRDTADVERLGGVPAVRLSDREPLLVGGRASPGTVLVIPIDGGERAGAVAERLAATASSRGMRPTVLDLSGGLQTNALDVNATITRLESEYGMVVVQLPSLTDEVTVAALHESRPVLLVTPPGRVNRARLVGAVQMLKRLEISCAGVVLSGEERRAVLTS